MTDLQKWTEPSSFQRGWRRKHNNVPHFIRGRK